MSFTTPAYRVTRQSVVGMEGMWAKMFDPPTRSPSTPDRLAPTNPVPEVMSAGGFQNRPSAAHTVQRDLLHGMTMSTWDSAKRLVFYTFRDKDNPATGMGNYPAATIRVPRGVIFHGETSGHGPPPHTIHWHGIEPTPMNDGVGHCSMELGHYTYQWQPNFIGTYFCHCHRNTVQHFEFGLFGLLLIEPPDAYFASIASVNSDGSVRLNSTPIGYCRDGKRRISANLTNFPQFPGFNSNLLTAPDPEAANAALPAWQKFQTDPHAMTVPYDVEALWVMDDRDSVWSDLAPDARATFPKHGDKPGINDRFHENAGGQGFFAFNDFNADYWFVTGVPVPAHKGNPNGETGTIPAGIVIPPELNSGVTGTQISIEAQVGQTILVRCLDAAYNCIEVSFPVDVVITGWDGRALGVPPYGYNDAYLVSANTPIHSSTARRFDALIRATTAVNGFATVKFIDTRGQVPGQPENVLCIGKIPINIGYGISGKVADSGGVGISGVTLSIPVTGAATKTVVTDASGNYSVVGLPNGSYTVTPAAEGFTFAPVSANVTVNGAVATQNFTSTQAVDSTTGLQTYSLSGSVIMSRGDGAPISGVTMSLVGPAVKTTVTDAGGSYRFASLPYGTYTVTPSLANYAFSPPNRKVIITGANAIAPTIVGRRLV